MLRNLYKKINSYYFRKESMCRQNSGVKLLLSNINYKFINIRNNRKPWGRLVDITISYI